MRRPPADVPLKLLIKNNCLRLITDRFEISVEVFRGWIDEYSLSLRQVLSTHPSTMRGSALRLLTTENHLFLNTNQLKAL